MRTYPVLICALLLTLSPALGCGGDGDGDGDADSDVDGDVDGDADTDADGDGDADADGDGDGDGDGDSDGDADADPDDEPDGDLDADGETDAEADGDLDGDPDEPVIPACEAGTLRVLRTSPWPGGGAQLVVDLRDRDGRPDPTAVLWELSVVAAPEAEVSYWTERVEVTSGITGVVVVPSGDEEVHARRVAAATVLIEALPERELVAVWRADESLSLVAELSVRRAHVLERLGSLPPGDVEGMPTEDDLAELVEDIDEVGGPTDDSSRFIVIVGDPMGLIELPAPMAPVLRLDDEAEAFDPCTERAGWGGDSTPEDAARQLAEHMAGLRGAMAVIGVCDVPDLTEQLRLSRSADERLIAVPEPLLALADSACVPEAAARDDYPYPHTVELVLTPEERETWDRFNAARSEETFPIHVKIGGSAPLEAIAHFRGQGSMGCARKSLNVEVMADPPLRLMPRSADTEFYLVSLCMDRGYFRQVLGDGAYQRADLFPLEHRLVEVRLNDESLGAFLMMEQPVRTLRRSATNVDRVIRRRIGNGIAREAELKYPSAGSAEEEEELLAEFNELAALVDTTDPELLWDTLSQLFDFDNYLRWLAINTLLHNGDYVDEAFFYASTELLGDGSEALYYRTTGWDPDDLDSACHFGGRYALVDPAGIVYCAEDQIDRSLNLSSEVYERFIEILEELIDESLSEEVFNAELDRIEADLFAVLDDEAACAAMIEIPAPDRSCAAIHAAISAQIDGYQASIAARRAELISLIDLWRTAP